MARRCGRALRSERCRAAVPHGHWKTTIFVGALRVEGKTAPMILDDTMHGAAFLTNVEQVLAPTLSPGDIVVMDTLPAHKPVAVRQAIARSGTEVRFLPPYSPGFNPIEMDFSKFKASLRRSPHALSTTYGTPPPRPSTCSRRPSAKTALPPPDMTANDQKVR